MIYLVYGNQNIRIKSQVKKIVNKYLAEKDDFNYVQYDALTTTIQEIVDDANYLPLGTDCKVVEINNCYFLQKEKGRNKIESEQDYDELSKYLNNPNPDCHLIFTVPSLELNSKSEFLKIIKNKGQCFEIADPDNNQWADIVKTYCKDKLECQIDFDALSELTERTQGDYALLQNSVRKLSLYTNHIKYDDVCLMVTRPLEDNAFQIFNYLLSGKTAKAIELFRDLKTMNVEPVTLVGMLSNQFRLLNEVLYLNRQKMSYEEIAKELAIKPIRVQILLKNAFTISENTIHQTLEDLFNLDLQIKSGQVDRYYAFELYLLNFKRK